MSSKTTTNKYFVTLYETVAHTYEVEASTPAEALKEAEGMFQEGDLGEESGNGISDNAKIEPSPTTDREAADHETPERKEIRMEWSVDALEGAGEWFSGHPDNRALLEREVAFGDKEFGTGTHRIVERTAS